MCKRCFKVFSGATLCCAVYLIMLHRSALFCVAFCSTALSKYVFYSINCVLLFLLLLFYSLVHFIVNMSYSVYPV